MKTRIITKKAILFIAMSFIFLISAKSQVTVGSEVPPQKAALLDIKSKDGGQGQATSDKGGILFPRVELDNINELTVFPAIKSNDQDYSEQKKKHIGLTVYNIKADNAKNIEEGIYVWNGIKWEKSAFRHRVNFFYMPSIRIDTRTAGDKTPINLYDEYKKQFESPKIVSAQAPDEIPFFAKETDLYYYVTDFDETVFDKTKMSISVDGKLSYSILSPAVNGDSYINIVFVVK